MNFTNSKDEVTLVTITEVDSYGEGLSGIPEDDERYVVQESAISDGLIELVVDSEDTPEPEFSLDKQAETIRNLHEKLLQQQKDVEQIQLELQQAKELFDDLAKKACGCEIEVEVSDEEPVVNDFENWKVGDTVKCISADEKWFTEGDTYTIDRFDLGDNLPVLLSNEYWIEPNNGDKFIKVS